MLVAHFGTKLPVSSREPILEETVLTPGDMYEARYDVTGGNLSPSQALEIIREIRQRSYSYAGNVSIQYAGVEENSPQVLRVQFKALSSHMCPFVVTAGFILAAVVAIGAGVIVGITAAIVLGGLDRVVTGITAPFAPTTTTTYIDPETGDEFGTYEEYVYAWNQRHPGVPAPEPGTQETTDAPWSTSLIGIVMLAGIALFAVIIYTSYFSGSASKAAGGVAKQLKGGKK